MARALALLLQGDGRRASESQNMSPTMITDSESAPPCLGPRAPPGSEAQAEAPKPWLRVKLNVTVGPCVTVTVTVKVTVTMPHPISIGCVCLSRAPDILKACRNHPCQPC